MKKIFSLFHYNFLQGKDGYEGVIASPKRAIYSCENKHVELKHLILCLFDDKNKPVLFESIEGFDTNEDKMAGVVIKDKKKIVINYCNQIFYHAGFKTDLSDNIEDNADGSNDSMENAIAISKLSNMILYFKTEDVSVVFTYDAINGFNEHYLGIVDAHDPLETVFQNYIDSLRGNNKEGESNE